MSEFAFHPEDKARSLIDRRLVACGWLIQSKTEMNLGVGLGVAVREFQTASGPVDYGLFVGRKLCGVIEAKAEGTTLSGYSEQAARYIADVLKHLLREEGQVRFEYVASGTETLFRDHAHPDPVSRRVLSFHRPETLERELREPLTSRSRLRVMPRFITDGLRACQIDAVSALEGSMGQNRPRALVQMATGAGKTFTACTLSTGCWRTPGSSVSYSWPTAPAWREAGAEGQKQVTGFPPKSSLRSMLGRALFSVAITAAVVIGIYMAFRWLITNSSLKTASVNCLEKAIRRLIEIGMRTKSSKNG